VSATVALLEAGLSREEQGVLMAPPRSTSGENALMDISNAMVRLYKDQFGRGPTRAHTHWAGHDALCVFLEDTLTPAERNMVRLGEHQRLRETRIIFQYATVRALCAPIERATGRLVRALISGVDTAVEGLSVETFVLHPAGYSGPSRADLDPEKPPED
jgi:uncharacterized protein YbcI